MARGRRPYSSPGRDGSSRGGRSRVLIVDDRPENLFAMTSVLEALDIAIMTASGGAEALSLMLRYTFAVVLLDVQMPGLDGFEIAELMREHEATRATPIIFVTAMDKDEHNIFRGYEAGAVDYLFKPVEPAILVSKVKVFLELFQRRQELGDALAELERANQDLDQFADALRGLVGANGRDASTGDEGKPLLDPEEMARRVRRFLDQRSARVLSDAVPDESFVSTRDARPTAMTRVRFLDEWYEIEGFRSPVLEVLMASMEDVVLLGRHVEAVHAELRREIEERRRAERESQLASQAKSRFLSNMSHELRTPLNAIIGLSELVLSDEGSDLDASMLDDIRLINESGHFLLALIDRLMERSQIELGRTTLDIEDVDVFALAQNVSASLMPVAMRERNTLTCECAQDIGVVRTDGVKLRQILHNLITNACKFTQDGVISLSVVAEQGIPGESVVFRVRDTGIGIAPERQQEIFDDFRQLDGTSSRRHGGVGLGLAICRHYAELMGATISVESTPGQGSTFILTVPVEPIPSHEHHVET